MDFKPGDVVKFYGWHAFVTDVLTSGFSGAVALQLAYAKDLTRNNPLEIHIITEDAIISRATVSDFAEEVDRIRKGQDERMSELVNGLRLS